MKPSLGTVVRAIAPLLIFLALIVLLWRGLSLDPLEVPSPLIDKPAPAFSLPRLDDPAQRVTGRDLLGQPWVLNVWASWCGPCTVEHPVWVDFARRHDVALVGLNHKDRDDNARAWLQRHGDPYRLVLVDADGRAGIDFGVYGVPETYVIDRRGHVRLKHVGIISPEFIRTRIEPLLKELADG
jgi:cytochrome c biogenesis protein CcmG, thiol:disulfide interchange protein DsbE